MKHDSIQRNRRDFLALSSLAALALPASAAPTPSTEDSHGYINFLKGKGEDVVPEGKWKATHADILGPFWAGGAPYRGKVTAPLAPGELLVMRGRVWSHRSHEPLANVVLDVWQADHKGVYDFQTAPRPDRRPTLADARGFSGGTQPARGNFKNRIRLVTDEQGYYEYETIKPAAYGIGRTTRPAHIHYMAQAKGHARVITQCYFKGDKHIAKDPWASKSPLIVALKKVKGEYGAYLEGQFDLVLATAGA